MSYDMMDQTEIEERIATWVFGLERGHHTEQRPWHPHGQLKIPTFGGKPLQHYCDDWNLAMKVGVVMRVKGFRLKLEDAKEGYKASFLGNSFEGGVFSHISKNGKKAICLAAIKALSSDDDEETEYQAIFPKQSA